MAASPSSPLTAPPEPVTPPSPWTITDGAISGTLPAAEAFAVHYPGYPSSPARAARTLGGLPGLAKVRSSDPGARLELRFRPEDPYCHPAFGQSRASTGLLLRLSKRKGAAAPCAHVVARVRTAYYFEGMADFQHVVPVHAAQTRKRKHSDSQNDNENFGSDKTGHDEADGDVMMLVPPLFSVKDRPTKIALVPSSNAISKTMHRGVVQERWEMNVGPTLALPFNTQVVPEKINWEDHIRKNSVEWGWQMAVCKLFDERPVWPRQSLYERFLDDNVHVSQNQFKRLLFRAGYYFSTGPFGKFWIRRGYDPRKDSESQIYQRIDFRMPPELRYLLRLKNSESRKWADMCKLETMPSQSFIYLQLYELKDDFIQAEIRKPSYQSVCSDRKTGDVIGTGHRRKSSPRLYILDTLRLLSSPTTTPHVLAASGPKTSFAQWHHRLGHLCGSRLSTLIKSGCLGSTNVESSFHCKGCHLGKQIQLPYFTSNSHSAKPFDLIHSNVWGPSPFVSKGGHKYYVIFIDDHPRYTWIYFMKRCSELPSIYKSFNRMVHT
ncbi:uncharacterized isoform X4 [Zea mays]|uniref:uncharacterized isoform X4 n=1 Tax=Zea mays TaxID=4577 RepID=UPI0009AAA181|nr:uncharacterized protein LOC100192729 isoform X4 [Zea mays]|eukprot:XP_020400454.1 uncharacterized LOC100192729 isoform X4 [Zea mays]